MIFFHVKMKLRFIDISGGFEICFLDLLNMPKLMLRLIGNVGPKNDPSYFFKLMSKLILTLSEESINISKLRGMDQV
jgi:hypothetical protein